ncbi:hypothetical protein C2E44_17450 [Enterobacter ludwigii]|nr:hypothetical protein C2E44_17450 [Enterobacter ludwigii]
MLQNTPENKHLPGWHPHSDRKLTFAVCYCIMALWDTCRSGGYLRPEWPKPPSPRSVASKSSTRLNSA